jgi:hypothetical protein
VLWRVGAGLGFAAALVLRNRMAHLNFKKLGADSPSKESSRTKTKEKSSTLRSD